MKPIKQHIVFFNIASIDVGELLVFDERNIDERIWCARTITLRGEDGSKIEIRVHSNSPDLPVSTSTEVLRA